MASVAPRNMSGCGFHKAYISESRQSLGHTGLCQGAAERGGKARKQLDRGASEKLLPSPGFGSSVTQKRGRAGQMYRLVSGLGCLSFPSHHLLASGQSTSQERCGQRAQILPSLPAGLAHFCHLPLTLPSLRWPVFLGFYWFFSTPLWSWFLSVHHLFHRGDRVFNPTVRSKPLTRSSAGGHLAQERTNLARRARGKSRASQL